MEIRSRGGNETSERSSGGGRNAFVAYRRLLIAQTVLPLATAAVAVPLMETFLPLAGDFTLHISNCWRGQDIGQPALTSIQASSQPNTSRSR